MTEAQIKMWRSALIEDTIDYLDDHEDYVVISIDKKTGDIIQQYEYEYSLARFLEHLASLQPILPLDNALQDTYWDEGGLPVSTSELQRLLSEMKRVAGTEDLEFEGKIEDKVTLEQRQSAGDGSGSGSPHTDPDFKDLDAFSDQESDVGSWDTYSDTSSERSSGIIREKNEVSGPVEVALDPEADRTQIREMGKQCENEHLFGALAMDQENEQTESVTVDGHVKNEQGRRGKSFGDLLFEDGLALAATANALMIVCMWIAERWK